MSRLRNVSKGPVIAEIQGLDINFFKHLSKSVNILDVKSGYKNSNKVTEKM